MIKTVCFDLYDTLARYDPPREEMHAKACRECGIIIDSETICKHLPAADKLWRDENSLSPISKRTPKEQAAVYARYEVSLLKHAGIDISFETALQIMESFSKVGLKFKIFDDSLPALKLLKDRGLTLGLISNIGQDIDETCRELGLLPYLDFRVTSFETGCDKPRPGIFQAALEKAQTRPEEAIYVGDQYDLDVVGARNVSMKAILIDRNDYFTHITDCPRIHSLTEIVEHIQLD